MTITGFPGPAAQPPAVPGLRLRTLLGRGGHGEVWSADDQISGERVAVKVGPAAGPASADSAIEAEIALLCRIEHPHIVRLRRVVPLADGSSAMVLELAVGGSLAALVAGRGPLQPGEVSTLLVPLASALDHLHRRGLAHGDLSPGNVLFAADGRPRLGDLGAATVLGVPAGESWRTPGFTDPAAGQRGADPRAVDVWGLAAVAWFALAGRPPDGPPPAAGDHATAARSPALARLLTECLAPDPHARPDPGDVSRRAWEAARPTPIRLIRPAAGGSAEETEKAEEADVAGGAGWSQRVTTPPVAVTTPPVSRATRPPGLEVGDAPVAVGGGVRRALRALTGPGPIGVLAMVGLAAAAVAAVVAGVAPGRPRPAPARPAVASPAGPSASGSAAPVAATPDLAPALAAIARARAEAFRTASAAAIARADETGSPAAAADLRRVRRLRASGRRLSEVSYTLADVRVTSGDPASGRTVTVSALAGTSPYRQVRVADGAAAAMPAQPARRLRFTLVRAAGAAAGWRLRSITEPGPGS